MVIKTGIQQNIYDRLPVIGEGLARGLITDTPQFIDQVMQNVGTVAPNYGLAALESIPALQDPQRDYFAEVQRLADSAIQQQNEVKKIRNSLINNIGKPLESVIGGIATEQQEQRYPLTSFLSRFAGGLPVAGVPVTPAIQAGKATILSSAAAGAVLGALATPSLEEAPASIGMGAAFGAGGAALAKSLPNAVQFAKNTAGRLKTFANEAANQAAMAYQRNSVDRFAVRRVQAKVKPTPEAGAKPVEVQPLEMGAATPLPEMQPMPKQGETPLEMQPEGFEAFRDKIKSEIRAEYGDDVFSKDPNFETSMEKMIREDYGFRFLGEGSPSKPLTEEQALALRKAAAKKAYDEMSSSLEMEALAEKINLLKQQKGRVEEYLAKRKAEPLRTDEEKLLNERLTELKELQAQEKEYQAQQKAIEAEQQAQAKLQAAEEARQQKINEQIEKLKAEQQAITQRASAEEDLLKQQAQEKAAEIADQNRVKELEAQVKEAESYAETFKSKDRQRRAALKEKQDADIKEIKADTSLSDEQKAEKIKALKKAQKQDLKPAQDDSLTKLEEAKTALRTEKEAQASAKAAKKEALRLAKEKAAIARKRAESEQKQKDLETQLEQLQAARDASPVETEDPNLPRGEVLNQWIKSTEERLNAEKTKQAALRAEELASYGFDKKPSELERELTGINKQLNQASQELKTKLKTIADTVRNKTEKQLRLADAVSPVTPTVEQLRQADMTGFAYKDGVLSAVSITPKPAATTRVIKKDGKTHTVELTSDGRVAQVDTVLNPKEKASLDAIEMMETAVDNVFSGKKLNEPEAIKPDEIAKSKFKGTGIASKYLRGIEVGTRKVFRPIQNAVDVIDQALGNKVARYQADLVANPKVLLDELKAALKLNLSDDKFIEYVNKLFPDKKFGLNINYEFEQATAAQKNFITRYNTWRKKYKAELELAGAKETEFVGAYLPRRTNLDWWLNRDGSEIKEFMANAKKQNPHADNDMILEAFNKERKVEYVRDELLDGYKNIGEALLIDIGQIGRQKAVNKFYDNQLEYGKGTSKLLDEMVSKIEDPIDREDAKQLIFRLFETPATTTDPLWKSIGHTANKLRYATMLGGVGTAATQLTALPRYGVLFGAKNMLQGFLSVGRKDLPIGISSIINDAYEGSTAGKLNALDKVFSTLSTGLFNAANKLEAKLGLSTAFTWLSNGAKKGNADVTSYLRERYGDRADGLIAKLKDYSNKPNKSFDAEIFELAFTAARDRGGVALAKADKTFKSLDPTSPLTRELYTLQTWAIKNANTVADLTIGQFKKGNTGKAIANTLALVAVSPLLQAAFQTGIESAGTLIGKAAAGDDVNLEMDALAQDRFKNNIARSYAGLVPMAGSPVLLNQIVEGEWESAIANYFVKGLGSMARITMNTGKAMGSGFTQGMRESKGNVGAGFLQAGLAAFDVDANKSFTKLPPRPITEAYYSIVDPMMRGANSRVVKDYAGNLERIYNEKPEVKLERQITQAERQLKAGVPESLVGTSKGQRLYEDATNKNIAAVQSTFGGGDAKKDFRNFRSQLQALPTSQRLSALKKYYDSAPSQVRMGILSSLEKELARGVNGGMITDDEAMNILKDFGYGF